MAAAVARAPALVGGFGGMPGYGGRNDVSSMANTVPGAQAQFAALSDPNRMINNGYVFDQQSSNVGYPGIGTDLRVLDGNGTTLVGRNEHAYQDQLQKTFKTEGLTFDDVHHQMKLGLVALMLKRTVESMDPINDMYPTIEAKDPSDFLRDIPMQTFNPGIALEQPDLGVPTMLTESADLIRAGMTRYAIGQMNGMWYGFTPEAARNAAPRLAQLMASFDNALLVRVYGEMARIISPRSIYTHYGIRDQSYNPLDAFRRLVLAAASQFGMVGKDPRMAGNMLRTMFTRSLSEVQAKFNYVLAPPGFSLFAADAPSLQDPNLVTQKRADGTYEGTAKPMDPVFRGVKTGVAASIPKSASVTVHPLIHTCTFGLFNTIGDARVITQIPAALYRSIAMDVRVYDLQHDQPRRISYMDALVASGLFGLQNQADAEENVREFLHHDSPIGSAYAIALRQRIKPAIGAEDQLTLLHLCKVNKLDLYMKQILVNNARAQELKRPGFTAAAINATLVRAENLPVIAGSQFAPCDAILGISLRSMTLATFRLFLDSDVPIPIPLVLNRPTIAADMGNVIGADVSDGIGRTLRTPKITTTTTELRQVAVNHVVCHMGVITIHPERVIPAYNVIPVQYLGGGGVEIVDNYDKSAMERFRTRLASAQKRGRRLDNQLTKTMIVIPAFAEEIERLSSARVLSLDPNLVNYGADERPADASHPTDPDHTHNLALCMGNPIRRLFYGSNGIVMPDAQARMNFSLADAFTLNTTSTMGWQQTAALGATTFAFTETTPCQIFGASGEFGLRARLFSGEGLPQSMVCAT